ncbi:MAG: ATP-binding cassette domain-containing protein, partial [bacterium]
VYLIPEDRRHSGLAVSLPIRENISLPNLGAFATLGIIRGQEERKMAEDMVTRLNVRSALQRGEGGANAGQVADAPAQSLSGGNQQKVVLAKWLAMEPKTLLFDEPTRGVDVGAKAEIYDLIRGLAANGVAVLLISSDMEEVLGVSDRIAVMHEGKITGILGRTDFSEENVMRLAVGDALSGKVAG